MISLFVHSISLRRIFWPMISFWSSTSTAAYADEVEANSQVALPVDLSCLSQRILALKKPAVDTKNS